MQDLLKSGLAQLVGFEPSERYFASLQENKRQNETYLPYAIGDGGDCIYYQTPMVGFSSTYRLSSWVGDYFGERWGRQREDAKETPLAIRRLDDISEIERIDFLKIDIQGGELNVFRHVERCLSRTLLVQTEVALMPFYEGQPGLCDIQSELEQHGLICFGFLTVNRRRLASKFRRKHAIRAAPSQVLDLDMVFVRDPRRLDLLESEEIKRLALLARAILNARDLMFRCIDELIDRGDLDEAELVDFFC